MATARHRGTPASLLTQNAPNAPNAHSGLQSHLSAPVLEFRCMFTHDIFKKSKKWHDGSLRYHTFNKRVMVYDETKNLVGDLHYRQPEDFGEGLELKLDTPVLVQVEEPLGQTNTDLTPLLARQPHHANNQPSSTHSQPTRPSLARVNAANSQARPKSIKELLAASQGTLGRARLPTHSPFDQRQALSDIQPPTQPSPKRRKITAAKENDPIVVPARAPPVRPTSIPTTAPLPRPIADISSHDEPHDARAIPTNNATLIRREKAPKKPKPLPAVKRAKTNEKTRADPEETSKTQKQREASLEPVSKRPPNISLHNDTLRRSHMPTSASESLPTSPSRPSSATTLQSQRRLSSGPKSSLKFASQKPRPKLMYKALLTSTSQALSTESPPARQRRTDLLDTESFFAASQIAQETAVATTRSQGSFLPDAEPAQDGSASSPSNRPDGSQEQALPDNLARHSPVLDDNMDECPHSPLFMPRTTSQISPMPSQRFNTDTSPFPRLSQWATRPSSSSSASSAHESHRDQSKAVSLQSPTSSGQHAEEQSSPTFKPAASKPPPQISTDEAATSGPTLLTNLQSNVSEHLAAPRPAAPRSLSKLKGRLFRRVVSEQLPMNTSTCDDSSLESDLDRDLDLLADSPVKLTPAKAARVTAPVPPAKLQRATSDPVVLDSTVTMHDPASSSPVDEVARAPDPQEVQPLPVPPAGVLPVTTPSTADAGPWTATEAFLLFDWWPPGKQKPDYGQGTTSGHNGLGPIEDSASVAMKAVANKKYGMFGSARLVSQR